MRCELLPPDYESNMKRSSRSMSSPSMDSFGSMSTVRTSERSMEPSGECRSTLEFWKSVAGALNRPKIVLGDTLEDFYDYRLQKLGMGWEEYVGTTDVHFGLPEFRKYIKTGFATPSGKVELWSSALEEMGFDPLAYFREDPTIDPSCPLKLFTGVREDGFFQTGHRHIEEMGKRHPEPLMFVSLGTATKYKLEEGEWVEVENELAKISIKVAIKHAMPGDLVRIPHGWWKPEMKQGAGHLSNAPKYADAQLCRDDEAYLDLEQGIPRLKGVPCRVNKSTSHNVGSAANVEAELAK